MCSCLCNKSSSVTLRSLVGNVLQSFQSSIRLGSTVCSALKEIDVVSNILDVKENMFGMCSMSQWLTEYFSLAVSLRNFFFHLD